MRPRARSLAVVAVGLLTSQLGHGLAYALWFGPEAVQRLGAGSHAYFPNLLGTSLALSAAVLAFVLLLVGLASLPLVRRTPGRAVSGWPFLQLVGALLLVQLCIYVAQELTEAAAGGAPPGEIPAMLAAGVAGQLPAAVAGALALSWLSRRLSQALRVLRDDWLPTLEPDPVAVETVRHSRPRRLSVVGTFVACSERGPPRIPR